MAIAAPGIGLESDRGNVILKIGFARVALAACIEDENLAPESSGVIWLKCPADRHGRSGAVFSNTGWMAAGLLPLSQPLRLPVEQMMGVIENGPWKDPKLACFVREMLKILCREPGNSLGLSQVATAFDWLSISSFRDPEFVSGKNPGIGNDEA
jgi:hypothetical protein